MTHPIKSIIKEIIDLCIGVYGETLADFEPHAFLSIDPALRRLGHRVQFNRNDIIVESRDWSHNRKTRVHFSGTCSRCDSQFFVEKTGIGSIREYRVTFFPSKISASARAWQDELSESDPDFVVPNVICINSFLIQMNIGWKGVTFTTSEYPATLFSDYYRVSVICNKFQVMV